MTDPYKVEITKQTFWRQHACLGSSCFRSRKKYAQAGSASQDYTAEKTEGMTKVTAAKPAARDEAGPDFAMKTGSGKRYGK
ncbi:hypothetical protein JD974_11185 [Chromobacterium haemolyticum]|uniref:Uncharacterized protein n=1 Tax=Chromobacterium haemolyticum TaxID=394935 RepID=A0ABS3GP43_9NEIS|nr:hypothetical protein [Chromobacterium haemolyticum]MBK0414968.1 hypothetical protein [Chromobacterium haemolyticum]MBO0416362.1 hypothetical protein [Chromobacterium haemolyticum]MBO0499606.1 hypothetical protein [Chromobacterium haemolyticum]MDH0343256.1 hypothetical protein [Chromobacterium haemolyticum]